MLICFGKNLDGARYKASSSSRGLQKDLGKSPEDLFSTTSRAHREYPLHGLALVAQAQSVYVPFPYDKIHTRIVSPL